MSIARSRKSPPESPLREVHRMRVIMDHFMKLSAPSRDFVRYLMEKYATLDLPNPCKEEAP